MTGESFETFDVIICGCGPTGAALSVLLGQQGVSHAVLERDAGVNTDPRGIVLDEEGIRCLQTCGVYEQTFTDIGQCIGRFFFISQPNNDLRKKPFLTMDNQTTEGGTGHPGFMSQKQPHIEKHLRARIEALPTCNLLLSTTVTAIREDEDWVYVTYTTASATGNTQNTIRARFLVGADGKTGYVRKNYLESRGIRLEKSPRAVYDEAWVALNWRISLPTPETHPDFPLWAKGYTPQQVFELFFPIDFRFLDNAYRPSVCGRFGMLQDRLWRFEYVVRKGEDPMVMASPENMARIVYPYITHSGDRYGLDPSLQILYPVDCIEVLRCRPFNFSASSCNRWAQGRVILCGDAAHVFPPFGGQGIASGFRDSMGLAWRLRVATVSNSPKLNYVKLLEGWYAERKQQLDRSLRSTIENGSYVAERNPVKIFFRDWFLWLIQLVPSWRHELSLGIRREGMSRYSWEEGRGMAFDASFGGGVALPQVYCAPVNASEPSLAFTDDAIFAAGKEGLFQLVVMIKSLEHLPSALAQIEGVEKASHGFIREDEITVIVENTNVPLSKLDTNRVVYRLATAGEFAEHKYCIGRPKPVGYDPYRIGKETKNRRFIIVRPDRFVFATCNTNDDLLLVGKKVASVFENGQL